MHNANLTNMDMISMLHFSVWDIFPGPRKAQTLLRLYIIQRRMQQFSISDRQLDSRVFNKQITMLNEEQLQASSEYFIISY
mmetsp:Transcript_14301/g.20054  ORF Transcript_14301/g.20054 Transcript_14301/m.20054 type:complete len:81 (+) Transcript_14301:168-410(+)